MNSCIIKAWELHPANRKIRGGLGRFLDYHEQLGPGVRPLFPVQRTWTLNESLGTKIRRQGFTLLPDYASTAFMIQGSTLPAAIADCGDVAECGGLSELMTTYVILSRVQSANGLLLLRAFCPNIFQMGAPPGPYCLLKLLHDRFSNAARLPYNTEAATVEYNQRCGIFELQINA